MKHTPTPWKVSAGLKAFYIESPDGHVIASTFYSDHTQMPERHANAQFIVKAVNNHDDLIAALQSIASCDSNHPGDVIAIARKALAKAK